MFGYLAFSFQYLACFGGSWYILSDWCKVLGFLDSVWCIFSKGILQPIEK